MTEDAGNRTDVWVFGYGSLIWRPDFTFLERRRARLPGWQRRFWQGSHDHRGLPHRPGRVVTLVETGHGHCDGVAYRLDSQTVKRTFEALDFREKNGYERRHVSLELGPAAPLEPAAAKALPRACALESRDLAEPLIPAPRTVAAMVYLATTRNHAFLGPAPIADMVQQIATCEGPSGANADYLIALAEALRLLGVQDSHVFQLETALAVYRS